MVDGHQSYWRSIPGGWNGGGTERYSRREGGGREVDNLGRWPLVWALHG